MKDIKEISDKLRKKLSYVDYGVTIENTDETQLISVTKGDQLWCLIAPYAYSATSKNFDLLRHVRNHTSYVYWIFSADGGYEVINRLFFKDKEKLPENPYRGILAAKTTLKESDLVTFIQQEPQTLEGSIIKVFQDALQNYKYKANSLHTIIDNITPDKIQCKNGVVAIEEQIEEKLFKNLIGEYEEPYVCRYTSLNSLFQTLTSQTFRLNGLAGMNDKGERDFLRNAIYQNDISMVYQEWLSKNKGTKYSERFIMSCTSIKKLDHLEMWRLYADEARGVCLVFEKTIKDNDFNLVPIRYDRCSDVKSDWTPQFKLITDITSQLGERGLLLVFHKFDDWKMFIKSGEYNYEKEVRLVYNPKDGTTHKAKNWVLTTSNAIVNPYKEFALTKKKSENDQIPLFPLKLKKIILGPKCPEANVNKEQIETLLSLDLELKELDIEVAISEIHNYR